MAEQFEVIMYAFGDNLEVATCHSVVCTPAAVSQSLFMILLVMCISLLLQKMEVSEKALKYLISMSEANGKTLNKVIRPYGRWDVLQAAKSAFRVAGDYTLEWYFPEFEEYVVVDDPVDFPSEGKARLVQMDSPSASATSPPPPTTSTPKLATQDTVLLRYGTPVAHGLIPLIPVGSSPA